MRERVGPRLRELASSAKGSQWASRNPGPPHFFSDLGKYNRNNSELRESLLALTATKQFLRLHRTLNVKAVLPKLTHS